ncbi:response regulator transcription factor [candidate division WOR-3 bacterium]|nr:response regulator transcription factor [candidate division WOR-3 bacterium]
MPPLIAVVDDENDILELVTLHLARAGYQVKSFADATSFLRFAAGRVPDLVVLDLMLPDMDGMDVCRELRSSDRLARVPVVMLTARTDEVDRILGLEVGADDYIPKPFSPRELVARVRAVLRRDGRQESVVPLQVGGISIDPRRHRVTVAGEKVDLTATEFRILSLLAEKPGWVLSRDQILDRLWGSEKAVIDRTVDVHIKNLRDKLGKAGRLIRSIRGVGYKLEE